MPMHYAPNLEGPPIRLFLAWCVIGVTLFAILVALLPALYNNHAPHQRQAYRRVAGTSLTAMLLAALAWILAMADHFPTFDFPFDSNRSTELRCLLHLVAPSLAGVAFLFSFVQAYAFWRKRTAETICGHCGYPLSNTGYTSTICAECGTTTADTHPIPPGFRPTTRLSLGNTIARFLLIAAAATLGWSLIYIPHIPTTPRTTTHHIQCAAPNRPTASIHFTITEHISRWPIPGASIVAFIDIDAEPAERHRDTGPVRIMLVREPFTEIRAIVDEKVRVHFSLSASRDDYRLPGWPRKYYRRTRLDTIGEGTYTLHSMTEGLAWCEPLSMVAVHVSPHIFVWPDPRRPCFRDELQTLIDEFVDQHAPRSLFAASSPGVIVQANELFAAATAAALAALLTLGFLRLSRRR